MSIRESLPALLADLRALRAEVDASPTSKGGDPLLRTCNDLALEVMRIGGMSLLVPPQWSGQRPSVETLLEDLRAWHAANTPREASTDPIAVNHPGRVY